jgi:hypothetical protein
MGTIFGYDSTDIEAQYKQDRYLKEAAQYRLISQIRRENGENNLTGNPGRTISSNRLTRFSHGQIFKIVLLFGRINRIND